MQQIVDNLDGVHVIWQMLGVFLAAAVPFIESYFGSVLGVVLGLPTPIAVVAAVLGNIASMVLLVLFGERLHAWRTRRKGPDAEPSKRQEKLRAAFDKWGIPGVSLLGQTLLPSQITSMAMVSFGANRSKVIFWQVISIILWGILFGTLAHFGAMALR